jgi:hypothetical protein
MTSRQLRRLTVQRNRLDASRARADTRQATQDRRTRTRHLIELGGLVQKAGLVDLVSDDRATLLGAFLEIADQLRLGKEGDDRTPAQLAAAWRRRGLRAFDADKDGAAVERPSVSATDTPLGDEGLPRSPPAQTLA